MAELRELEKSIGYNFNDINLLRVALTHTSYANDNKVESYEKLEYLGDSILEFVTSEYLYENYKDLKEGEMTKVRAFSVCENSLYEVSKKHNFSDFLILGKSEISSKGDRKAILADIVEAIIAAMYLDSKDINTCKHFIIDNLKDTIEYASKNVGIKDYKTVLQEKLQVNGTVLIKYNIIKEFGPDHNKEFTAEVLCEGKKLAEGIGRSKKAAEMEAARKAIDNLK